MKSRGINHALHYGGQTTLQNEEAKKRFKTTSECNVLLSSDAGSHGMNMPEARVVINFDCPYDYDTLMQRNDRIDRADTFLDGLESRLYYYEDTVEEYIWGVNNERRLLSYDGGSVRTRLPEGAQEEETLQEVQGRQSLIVLFSRPPFASTAMWRVDFFVLYAKLHTFFIETHSLLAKTRFSTHPLS